MRGGAIPLLIWGTALALVLALNWVWTGDAIQVASFGYAILTVLGWVATLMLLRPREALRRGAPPVPDEPEAVPSASYGSVLLAVGVGATVFGFVFGHFFIYFGIGVIVIAGGAVGREVSAERRARRRWTREERV